MQLATFLPTFCSDNYLDAQGAAELAKGKWLELRVLIIR
jgi:hypothetical protein